MAAEIADQAVKPIVHEVGFDEADRDGEPLVGIDEQRVGPREAGHAIGQPRIEHREGAVGAVHVQPDVSLARDVGHLADRIDCAGRGVAGGGDQRDRGGAGGQVAIDRMRQRGRVDRGTGRAGRQADQGAAAEAEDREGAADDLVAGLAGIDPRLRKAGHALLRRVDPDPLGGPLARRRQPDQVGHCPAAHQCPGQIFLQAKNLSQPPEGDHLGEVAGADPPALGRRQAGDQAGGRRHHGGCGRDPAEEAGLAHAEAGGGELVAQEGEHRLGARPFLGYGLVEPRPPAGSGGGGGPARALESGQELAQGAGQVGGPRRVVPLRPAHSRSSRVTISSPGASSIDCSPRRSSLSHSITTRPLGTSARRKAPF